MTIEQLFAILDEEKPNTYSDSSRIRWLNDIEGRIMEELVKTHKGSEEVTYDGYTEADVQAELIAKPPYDNLYLYYLYAMIDFSNMETERYNNSMIMFNQAYQDFASWYNRTHMPLATPLRIW
jgi:hypothetical protein